MARGITTISRVAPVVLILLATMGVSACSSGAGNSGLYAEAKQDWDSPHSPALHDALRNRLAHTQRDN